MSRSASDLPSPPSSCARAAARLHRGSVPLACALALPTVAGHALAAPVAVATSTELRAAIAAAAPGTTITLAPGAYALDSPLATSPVFRCSPRPPKLTVHGTRFTKFSVGIKGERTPDAEPADILVDTNEFYNLKCGPGGIEGPTRAAPCGAQPPSAVSVVEANCALSSDGA